VAFLWSEVALQFFVLVADLEHAQPVHQEVFDRTAELGLDVVVLPPVVDHRFSDGSVRVLLFYPCMDRDGRVVDRN
jgi:hypothetical protein